MTQREKEMLELKPCPFCGSQVALSVLEDEPGEVLSAWVACPCGVEIHERRTEGDAAMQWNCRAEQADSNLPRRCAGKPVASVVACYTPSGKRVALYTKYQDLPIGTELYAAAQADAPGRHEIQSSDGGVESRHAGKADLAGREPGSPKSAATSEDEHRSDADRPVSSAGIAPGPSETHSDVPQRTPEPYRWLALYCGQELTLPAKELAEHYASVCEVVPLYAAPQPPQQGVREDMTADYAEILRLYRKYSTRDGEALCDVFIRIGRELESSAKKLRCPSCFYTDKGYERLVEHRCNDPWHRNNHLRAKAAAVTSHVRQEGS